MCRVHVPLTDLGETWIDAGLAGDKFRATIYLDNPAVRDRVRADHHDLARGRVAVAGRAACGGRSPLRGRAGLLALELVRCPHGSDHLGPQQVLTMLDRGQCLQSGNQWTGLL